MAAAHLGARGGLCFNQVMAQVIDRAAAARQAAAENRWADAYQLLTEADAESPLAADDLGLLVQAAFWSKSPEAAVPFMERAYRAQLEAGNKRAAAALAIDLAHEYGSVKLQKSVGAGWLARAERLLADQPEGPEHGYLALQKGLEALSRNDFEAVLEHGRTAERLGKEHGDRALEVRGIQRQGVALVYSGEVNEGNLLLDEAAAAAFNENLDPYSTLVVYCNVIGHCRDVASFDRAAQWTERAQKFCDDHSVNAFPGMCRVNRAEVMRFEGKLADAEATASQAYEELHSWAPRIAAAALNEVGEVRLRLGELRKAEEAFEQADDLGREPEPGRSLLALARGKVPAAYSSIRRALQDETLSPIARARLLPAFVEIAVAAGELDAAEEAAQELDQIAGMYDTVALHATAEQAEGSVRLARGEPDRAVAPLRRALRAWRDTNARYEEARTRLLLGRAYRESGDEEGAIAELARAGQIFDQLGARLDVDRVNELLGRDVGEQVTRTFMFTDIVESTRLLEAVGDEAWGRAIRWHNDTLQLIFDTNSGEVVEDTGDGFFVAFDDVSQAVGAAMAIQRARTSVPIAPEIRIGIHTDEAIHIGENYRGAGVHAAARIGSLGGAGEIVASAASVAGLDFAVSEPRTVELKGLAEPIEVVTIDWR
jgi:class 3 adenylate cyclase